MHNELQVTINGKVSIKHKAKHALRRISRAFSREIRVIMRNISIELDLLLFDMSHNTNLYREYLRKKEAANVAKFKQQYGL